MKQVILMILASAFASLIYAQDTNFNIHKRIDKDLSLSREQIAEIKKLKREMGYGFRAIGKSNLPRYEKGQRKRILALEYKTAIKQIFNRNQIETWENNNGYINYNEGITIRIGGEYDILLEQLEEEFEQEKKVVEHSNLPEYVRKDRIKILKNRYKEEKERLKNERSIAKKSE